MFMLIAVLIPSVIGVKVIESLMKEEKIDKKRYIYFFLVLLLSSSIINNIISYVLFDVDMNILEFLNTFPIFFVKYCIVSILINVVIAFIIVVILKKCIYRS